MVTTSRLRIVAFPMTLMFNRDDHGFYRKYLSEFDARSKECDENKAVIENLKYDHRVCEKREEKFRDELRKKGGNPVAAVRAYHKAHSCVRQPDFSDPYIRQNNMVDTSALHPETKFVNVLDLSSAGICQILLAQDDFPFYAEEPGEPRNFPVRYAEWLDTQLNVPFEQQKEFVGRILQAMNRHQTSDGPHNPTWVIPYKDFQPFLDKQEQDGRANQWAWALGLAKEANRWLVVLTYSFVQLGRKLFRPTQLDAGNSPWHFPSHPRRDVTLGGQPMLLHPAGHSVSGGVQLAEFIHEQWEDMTGDCCLAVAKTTASAMADLQACRRRHREMLKSYDALPDLDWYPCK